MKSHEIEGLELCLQRAERCEKCSTLSGCKASSSDYSEAAKLRSASAVRIAPEGDSRVLESTE